MVYKFAYVGFVIMYLTGIYILTTILKSAG